MGARPRRRRRAAPKRRIQRWLRRQDRFTRGLLVAVIALSALVVALVAPRLSEDGSETRIARNAPLVERRPARPEQRPPAARKPAPRAQQHSRPSPSQPQPRPQSQPQSEPQTQTRPQQPSKSPHPDVRTTRPPVEHAANPRVAIVIDDLGQNFSHLEQLAGLDIPLSIAVIPGLPATARTVKEASRRGIELLLHQPMEPREERGKNPGAGVLLTSMTAEELRAQVRASIAAVPGAVGVNNHMGSRFTEDAAGLDALMVELKEHGLFWLDSRTTSGSRGVEAAHAAGVPSLGRDIFIDAKVSPDLIRRQVRRLIDRARVHGTAVGIGHPHPETIAVLREMRAELLDSGVTLVPVSALMRGNPAGGPGTALAAALAGKKDAAARETATP